MIEFPLNLRDDKEYWAWFTGSVWLSLDRFERFWPDVGLMLSNRAAVKSAVRHVLCIRYAIDTQWRASYLDDPDAPEDLQAPDPKEGLPQLFFRRLNETAGPQDAGCVARWLKGPVLGAINEHSQKHDPWHYTWHRLFYRLGQENPNTLANRYGILEGTAKQLVDIVTACCSELEAMEERVEAADQEPLTGWDAIAYADYRWDSHIVSPLDGLRGHIRYAFFDRSWAKILRCTRATDLDGLIQWGRAHAAAAFSDSIQDADVIIPDDVRAGWAELHAKP